MTHVNVKSKYGTASPALGDGVTDDTDAIQNHIDQMSAANDHRILYFPEGRYLVTSTISVPARAKLVGEGTAMQRSTDAASSVPAVLVCGHTGTGMEIVGDYATVENLTFHGTPAEGDAISCVHAVELTPSTGGQGARIRYNQFYRTGGKASVKLSCAGSGHFIGNRVSARANPANWSHDGSDLRPTRGHAVWCETMADFEIASNTMTGEGAGLFLQSVGGLNIHDNFIFNSNVGVYFMGASRCSFADNRCEEHCREGLILDWASDGNTIVGNRFHNNGARVAEADADRVGVSVRSGQGNVITGNAFDNWPHEVTQEEGAIDLDSPQQYGLRINPIGETSSPTRPWPDGNAISGNTFRRQQTDGWLDEGDEGLNNVFTGNVESGD